MGGAGSTEIISTLEAEFEKLQEEVENKSLYDLSFQKRIKDTLTRHVAFEKVRQQQCGIPPTETIGAQLLLVANDVKHNNPMRIWAIGCRDDAFLEQLGGGCVGDGTLFAHMALLNYRSTSIYERPKSKSLSAEQGCLVAFRAVRDAIEASLDRVGLPIDIWTIKDNEKPTQASGQAMKKLEEAYVTWKEAEITKLQELI